jgi:7,8-dihydropterin-6-yl-methyl-4-(beta-D-ribofuranosyl)aminobenzene 5'-phosphate synthase
MIAKMPLKMSIVYDNNPYDRRLSTDWGFSCLVEGLEKSILFDTGARGEILLSNMEKLGIHPNRIDAVVLSHAHRDHIGGLEELLSKNSEIEVWLPFFFPSDFKQKILEKGASIIDVEKSHKICEGAYTSGVFDGWIKEQSLVLEIENGLLVMTGCAHPRITSILSEIKENFKQEIFLALGGFHLAGFDEEEIEVIIEKFRKLNVRKVGPSHCSGNDARIFFYEEYKDDFIEIGVGKEIEIQ